MKAKLVRESLNEISTEYIKKKVKDAKRAGRRISRNYRDNLIDKEEDTLSFIKKKNYTDEKSNLYLFAQEISNTINTNLEKIYSYFNTEDSIANIYFKSCALYYYPNKDELLISTEYSDPHKFSIDLLSVFETEAETSITTLSKIFQKYFPNSKYSDRKYWSSIK